jgi:hypothetical protein
MRREAKMQIAKSEFVMNTNSMNDSESESEY